MKLHVLSSKPAAKDRKQRSTQKSYTEPLNLRPKLFQIRNEDNRRPSVNYYHVVSPNFQVLDLDEAISHFSYLEAQNSLKCNSSFEV